MSEGRTLSLEEQIRRAELEEAAAAEKVQQSVVNNEVITSSASLKLLGPRGISIEIAKKVAYYAKAGATIIRKRRENDRKVLTKGMSMGDAHMGMLVKQGSEDKFSCPDAWKTPEEELGMLGVGVEMYFKVLRYCVVIFMLLGVVMTKAMCDFAIQGTICNGDCASDECSEFENRILSTPYFNYENITAYCDDQPPEIKEERGTGILKLSIGHNNPYVYEIGVFGIGMVVLMLVFLLFIRWTIAVVQRENDLNNITPADYTLHLKNIPEEACDEKELKEHIEEHFGTVTNVAVSLTCRDLLMALKDRRNIVDKREELEAKRSRLKSDDDTSENDAEFAELERKQEELNAKIREEDGKNNTTTGQAFVTFEYEKGVALCAKKYKRTFFNSMFLCCEGPLLKCCGMKPLPKYRGITPSAKRAPEPSDVYWENLEVGTWQVRIRTAATFAATLVVLAISTSMLVGFSYWKRGINAHLTNEEESASLSNAERRGAQVQLFFLSVLGSFFVTFVNTSLRYTILFFTQFERQNTITDYENSLFRKLSLAYLMNNVVLIMIINHEMSYWYGSEGVALQAFYLMISNCVIPSVLLAAQPFAAYYHYTAKNALTQKKANTLYAPPPFFLGEKYAALVKTIGLGLFYGPMMPLAYFLTAITVVFEYWINKYAILKIYKEPPKLNGDLAESFRQLFQLLIFGHIAVTMCVLSDSLGYITWSEDEQSPHAWYLEMSLALWVVYSIIPWSKTPCFSDSDNNEGDGGTAGAGFSSLEDMTNYVCPVAVDNDPDEEPWEQDHFKAYIDGKAFEAQKRQSIEDSVVVQSAEQMVKEVAIDTKREKDAEEAAAADAAAKEAATATLLQESMRQRLSEDADQATLLQEAMRQRLAEDADQATLLQEAMRQRLAEDASQDNGAA